jgi:hypothetical protein
MPTIHIESAYRFFFYLNEGERVHIHATKDGGHAKVWMDSFSIARHKGFKKSELKEIVKIAKENKELIIRSWNECFGN